MLYILYVLYTSHLCYAFKFVYLQSVTVRNYRRLCYEERLKTITYHITIIHYY